MNQEEAIKNIECDLEKVAWLAYESYATTISRMKEFAYNCIHDFLNYFDLDLPNYYKPLELDNLSSDDLIDLVCLLTKDAFITIINKINDYDCLSDDVYRKYIEKVLVGFNNLEQRFRSNRF